VALAAGTMTIAAILAILARIALEAVPTGV
jgi:hypothetical protein